jgi:molybdopterin converting factor small subunit
MKVTVRYSAQAREASGRASETVDLEEPHTVRDLIVRLARQHGSAFRRIALGADGTPHPSLLVAVGDEQVRPNDLRVLRAGDVVFILTPIGGG